MEMRQRKYSYRETSRFMAERCGLVISHNAVRNFINRHCHEIPEAVQGPEFDRQRARGSNAAGANLPEMRDDEAVRARIVALKRRSQLRPTAGPDFRFDPAQPLRLPDE
jgi:hypothetical protein